MGKKLVEIIRDSKTTFDQQTKLELSGVLYSFGDADFLSILTNGYGFNGLTLSFMSSDLFESYQVKEKDFVSIEYPSNQYAWASSYFTVDALYGRVNEMDFSYYSKVSIEMRGKKGGEQFEIAMKDFNDPPDGSKTKLKITLTKDWKIFEIDTKQFLTTNMINIMVALEFVFEGAIGMEIHWCSVQFKKL